MGIMIRRVLDGEEIVSAPVMVCDECGELIRRAVEGLYAWDSDEVGEANDWDDWPTDMAQVHVVHKTTCDRRDLWDCSAELCDLPLFLRQNLDGAT